MKRVTKLVKDGQIIDKMMRLGLKIQLETGLPRIEVTASTIKVVNASKLVNGARLLYCKIGSRMLEVDEDFSELLNATSLFEGNGNRNLDFSKLKFPKAKIMNGMFASTTSAIGYPSEFPKATNLQYAFRGANLKEFLFDLSKATFLYCVADLCENLEIVDTKLPVCESLYHGFAACSKMKTARIIAPICSNFQMLFLGDEALQSVDILNANSGGILSRVYIDQVCITCSSLLTFSMEDTSRVYSADSAFENTPKLKIVPLYYPLLFTGKGMFKNSNLTSDQINAILTSLPVYTTGTHIITFTGCPGATTCDATIATAKGWTVEI